jgi:hypothetical protein
VATRKQRRRRDKEKRHEYEVVYVDDAGNEVEPEPGDVASPRKQGKASRSGTQARRRGGAQPPSWSRTFKRGAIFAPIMYLTVLLLGGTGSTVGNIVQTVILVSLFIPFSYVLDGFMWRSQLKREERARAGTSSKRGT